MKRKVANTGVIRLSPNEEALLLKQERERRRKLRLQQVREQEKFIALQIRHNVKERREQELQNLAEELRLEWQASQAEKLRALEKLYVSSLSAIGEGHRQAKENEPDLQAVERQAAANRQKAEKRHREALRELKQHKEKQLREQTWLLKARRKALITEKERAAKIASLPPPPPDPLENIEVLRRFPTVKLCNVDGFSVSHYHLPEPYVDRETDTEQPDARVAAEEEAKRLDALQKEEERERRERMEKAHLRGSHALKKVLLTQDRDKLLKELEQMQQEDLAQRRQVVAQMPQQLFEPAYRREEIQEEWQRELEVAFEDMYTGERRVRGDMVLHLKPQPLPVPSAESFDDDLDLSVDPEPVCETQPQTDAVEEPSHIEKTDDKSREPQSRIVFKRLLNKIRSQQDQWSAKSDVETQSDTVESGSLPNEIHTIHAELHEARKPAPEGIQNMSDSTILAGNAVPRHATEPGTPTKQASDWNKQDLERQKQEQLDLLNRLEEEKKRLEAEYLRVQLQMQKSKQEGMEPPEEEEEEEAAVIPPAVTESKTMEEPKPAQEPPGLSLNVSTESPHIQIIRQYQQRLIEQNRQHKQSVEEARQRLQEYQQLLKKRYSHLSASRLQPAAKEPVSFAIKPGLAQKPAQHLEDIGGASDSHVRVTSYPGESLAGHLVSLGSSLISAVPVSGQNLFAPSPVSRTAEFGQSGSSPLPHSTEQDNFIPYSSGTIPTQQQYGGAESMTGKDIAANGIKSPKRATPLGNFILEVAAPRLEQYTSSPEEDSISPPYSMYDLEKQSSTSSKGDYDTASDSFYALPSSLSLGLPQNIENIEQEPHVQKVDSVPFGEFSNVHEFRKGLISSTAKMQAQQTQLRDMQLQLEMQRESLLSKQKSQEEGLLQKQKELEDQMRKHQESLEHFLANKESAQGALPPDLCQISNNERLRLMSALLKALGDGKQENLSLGNGSSLRAAGRELKGRPSKPPVTKTKLGPSLEQHELSAILEVETPSGRPSSTGPPEHKNSSSGRQDGAEGGNSSVPPACMQENSRLREAGNYSLGDPDLSRTSTSSNESNRSQTKLSWRQMLSLAAASSHNLTLPDQSWSSSVHSGLSPHPAGTKTAFHFQQPAQERSDWLGAAELGKTGIGYSAQTQARDAFSDHLSTTTISTGSFLTSEKADSSISNLETISDLHKCNFSIINGAEHGNWSTSVNGVPQPTRRDEFPSPEYLSTAPDQRSHIQQIIDKYTRDLSASLERNLSFHTPTAALDVSGNDNHLPSGFYALEPKPDFNVSTTSHSQLNNTGSSQEAKNTSQSSFYPSSKEWSSEQSHSFQYPDSSHSPMSSPGITSAQHVDVEITPHVRGDQTLGSSGSFHPLHPECTLNEPPLSSPGLCGCSSAVDDLGNGSMKASKQHALQSSSVDSGNWNTNSSPGAFQPSVEPLRADSHTLLEDLGSFHELMATETTANESELSEHPLTAVGKTKHGDSQQLHELPVLYEALEPAEIEASVGDYPGLGSVPQHSNGDEGAEVESSSLTLKSDTLTEAESSVHPDSSSAISSSAFSLGSFSLLRDTHNARGIMEEPELSLVSFPDSSFAGSEHVTTLTSMSDHHVDPSFAEGCFHPLPAEVDHSMFNMPDWSAAGPSFTDQSTPQHFAALDWTSPVSLQEALLKKKKHFIESSSKRVEQIKQKAAAVGNPVFNSTPNVGVSAQEEASACDEASASDSSTLKKVVEVRVCTPEERKLSEIEMHQRTIRLYNQLDEVKTKKEEKMRKESYARNREKANEFKKKTLEKLRSRRK
ncbi:centrosomal protein of 295 kDa [Xenopus tropicalis]|uniref:Centrosomal protein of 295 kDa n=1 Tax=Xenopus tropicalis TaxID=8364 RepID=A0A8J0QGN5_XENTR|nr:centrosomal protein of 295 kDa [Xenopus tropicalis]|eukprot:NP_001186852.1 centrosomal protein of 295 kDa [Xenopus tropicalis]